jgi:hypothetical protein
MNALRKAVPGLKKVQPEGKLGDEPSDAFE